MLIYKFSCRYYIYCVFIFSILFEGCSFANDNMSKDQLKYFDLDTYFNEQIDYLLSNNPKIFKTIFKNNANEKKELSNINWTEELAIFKEHDLNRPAWHDSYNIDSVITDRLNYEINYHANEPSQTTYFMNIKVNDGKVTSILIKDKTENILYSTSKVLIFLSGTGYSVGGNQKVRFMDEVTFAVNVKFIK